MEHTCSAVELRSIDPSRRRARRYRVTECGSLFGEPGLLIVWGRIGGPARVRLETFATAAERFERRAELLARRTAHGYCPLEPVAGGKYAADACRDKPAS